MGPPMNVDRLWDVHEQRWVSRAAVVELNVWNQFPGRYLANRPPRTPELTSKARPANAPNAPSSADSRGRTPTPPARSRTPVPATLGQTNVGATRSPRASSSARAPVPSSRAESAEGRLQRSRSRDAYHYTSLTDRLRLPLAHSVRADRRAPPACSANESAAASSAPDLSARIAMPLDDVRKAQRAATPPKGSTYAKAAETLVAAKAVRERERTNSAERAKGQGQTWQGQPGSPAMRPPGMPAMMPPDPSKVPASMRQPAKVEPKAVPIQSSGAPSAGLSLQPVGNLSSRALSKRRKNTQSPRGSVGASSRASADAAATTNESGGALPKATIT